MKREQAGTFRPLSRVGVDVAMLGNVGRSSGTRAGRISRLVRLWGVGLAVLATGCGNSTPELPAAGGAPGPLDAAAQGGQGAGGAGTTTAQEGVFAVPQEELSTMKDAIKVTGTITVQGYANGLLQIDATKPVASAEPVQGIPPVTVARYKSPGPYELFLPPGLKEVTLNLILDIKGNGPDSEDPKLTYTQNPLKLEGAKLTGIDFVLDKTTIEAAAASAPNPEVANPPPQAEGQPAPAGGADAAVAPSGAASAPAGGASTMGSAAPAAAPAAPAATAPSAAAPSAAAPSSTAPAKKADALSTLAPKSAPATAPAAAPAPGQAPGAAGKKVTDVLDESLDSAPKVAK